MTARRAHLISLLLAAAALLPAAPAAALNPQTRLADYNHTSWTAKDGAPAEINTMAQTPDGWLWLGTSTGLYRFDGVHFDRYPLPESIHQQHNHVRTLFAGPNGDLWIGYGSEGLSVLHRGGAVENIPFDTKLGLPNNFVFDRDGNPWITSVTGMYHYVGGKLSPAGAREGLADGEEVYSMLIDRRGRFWINNRQGVSQLNRDTGRFEATGISHNGGSLGQSPDGRIWLIDDDRVEQVPATPAGPRAADLTWVESRRLGLFDRDGNLWSTRCRTNACVVAGAGARNDAVMTPSRLATDKLDQAAQLSAPQAECVLEDREGNLWIATQGGLDRYRENRLTAAHLPVSFGVYTMASDASGAVWAAEPVPAALWRLDRHAAPAAQPGHFGNVANDRDGALLLAGPRSIERRYRGRVEQIALPLGRDGKPIDQEVVRMVDDGKILWMVSNKTGLNGWIDGHWLPRGHFNLPPKIYTIRPGGLGQLWLSVADGSIVLYDNDRQVRYDDPGVGTLTEIHAGREVVVGGSLGMAVLHGRQFRHVRAAEPAALTWVSGIAATPDGDRWFNGALGIVHVLKADWDEVARHPDALLRYELIDAFDGYPGRAMLLNRARSIYTAPDGELWFMTSSNIVHIDPRQLKRNSVAPQVQIERLLSGDSSYAARAALTLPAASPNFSIEFTSPSLSQPEKVRFQYQLVGVDAGWQDAGARRTAYYTNVEPGSYRFRVRVRNEDGVAGLDTAELSLRVPPAFWQTLWFKLACGLAAAGLLYLLYLYRVRIATARVAERLHVRMAERERIARTLHDTILQSVQAITLRLHLVAQTLPPGDDVRDKLDVLLDQADHAYVEGRDQVHELRAGQAGDVEDAVADAGQQLALLHPATGFRQQTSGARRRLNSPVAEEACEIAREALRNAFRHAGAAKVEALLSYDADQFTLLVQDNGRGIGAARADDGAEHWGLVGMRERAARIGARLAIDGKPGAGTRVTLTVPGRLAYAGRRRWPGWRWFRRAPAK